MAIATGTAVNLHIIQATQAAEGYQPCFGRAMKTCSQEKCAYFETCMALVAFDAESTLPISAVAPASRRMPTASLVHPNLNRTIPAMPAFQPDFAKVGEPTTID